MTAQKPNIADMQKHNRSGRICRLLAAIQACKSAGRAADKEKVTACFCLDWGASRRTVLEYLKILEMAEKITIIGNEITLKNGQA